MNPRDYLYIIIELNILKILPIKQKSAIFFDRDGVLIDDVHYISNPLDVKILSGVKIY